MPIAQRALVVGWALPTEAARIGGQCPLYAAEAARIGGQCPLYAAEGR
jgi:hypothetical protein